MTRGSACLIALMLSGMTAGYALADKIYDVSEVTVIRTGSGFMYKYTDETGQIVVRDVPPPGYLESLTAERAKEPVPVEEEVVEPVLMVPEPVDPPLAWHKPVLSTLAGLLALAAVFVFVTPLNRRWRRESPLERVLRRAGFPVFREVELSGKDHPTTKIDCLACTPAGILVIGDVKLAGTISGEPQHDFWMQNVRNEALQIGNPLPRNARDTRVVQSLLGNVPVHGRVVYTGRPELPAALKLKMESLSAFAETLDSFRAETQDQRSLAGGWRTLMRYPRANKITVRAMGAGWKRWLYDRRRVLASGGLLAVSLAMLATVFWMESSGGG